MGSAESQPVTMRAFIIVALAAAVHGEAKPYTVGQVLAGATNGGVITSTTYHGGLKVAGFPHAAVVPALGLSFAFPFIIIIIIIIICDISIVIIIIIINLDLQLRRPRYLRQEGGRG